MPAGAIAARPGIDGQGRRFERVDVSKIDKSLIKAILADHDVNVIVEMRGPAAATVDVSRVGQVATAKRLKTHQDTLAGSIKKLGGTVQAKYQYAYNGIKVRIAGRSVAALAKLPGVEASTRVPTYTRDNVTACRSSAPRRCGRTSASPATARRSPSSTPASTTPTPTSAAPGTRPAYDDNDPTSSRPARSRPPRSSAAGTSSATTTTPTGDDGSRSRRPIRTRSTATATAPTSPARAAGFGVRRDGTTYTGPYNAHDLQRPRSAIGPGVAPQGHARRPQGLRLRRLAPTLTDALNWVADYNAPHADASTSSTCRSAPRSAATTTRTPSRRATRWSRPASSSSPRPATPARTPTSPARRPPRPGVIAVAASDTLPTFPGAVDRPRHGRRHLNAINQNAWPGLPVSGTLEVDRTTAGGGLSASAARRPTTATLPANTIAVIQRGVCAFVDKGAAAQAAGAIGVIVVNRDDIANPAELPTFIGYNPDDLRHPDDRHRPRRQGRAHRRRRRRPRRSAGRHRHQPDLQAARQLQRRAARATATAPPSRTSPPRRARSSRPLVGSGNKGTTLSRHLDGLAACRRRRRARPCRNPTWTPERGQGRDRRHRRSRPQAQPVQRPASPARAWSRRAGPSTPSPSRRRRTAPPSLSFGYDPSAGRVQRDPRRSRSTTPATRPITYNLAAASIVSLSPAIGHRPGPLQHGRRRHGAAHVGPARGEPVREPDPARRHRVGRPAQLRRRRSPPRPTTTPARAATASGSRSRAVPRARRTSSPRRSRPTRRPVASRAQPSR